MKYHIQYMSVPMHRNLLKLFCLFAITLLICGPAVTVKTIAQENQQIEYKNTETLFTDEKIQS